MKKLEDYILYHALKRGEQIAFISGKERLTYKQLYLLKKSVLLFFLRKMEITY